MNSNIEQLKHDSIISESYYLLCINAETIRIEKALIQRNIFSTQEAFYLCSLALYRCIFVLMD